MTDDASVLPVPNYVVPHHLSTGAIKSGVLAVADTVQYKKVWEDISFFISSLVSSIATLAHRFLIRSSSPVRPVLIAGERE